MSGCEQIEDVQGAKSEGILGTNAQVENFFRSLKSHADWHVFERTLKAITRIQEAEWLLDSKLGEKAFMSEHSSPSKKLRPLLRAEMQRRKAISARYLRIWLMSAGPDVNLLILDKANFGEAFEDLACTFGESKKDRTKILKAKLRNWQEADESFQAGRFLGKMKAVLDELESLGCEISDEKMNEYVFGALPPSWDIRTEIVSMSWSALTTLIKDKAGRMLYDKWKQQQRGQAAVLEVSGDCKKSTGKRCVFSGDCYNCGERGHRARECKQLTELVSHMSMHA
ncbi:hypothetical protein BCR37DRAFT_392845 [Protomyces lactucae-debilis]|uniref:CCHC-type domain-containing protein n=1 Tax=Protomyces lactucae-debilis TaxID=2754530 RepID=A0A1Y2FFE0_PROLT|nr:uncharacterized protein BCR37DRAFT_392845 [Protomyces lactucae-debilis]ORY82643.1 hypothetical protein BCR37DRAFT_392845 [Protomyces lactucae-debilis]